MAASPEAQEKAKFEKCKKSRLAAAQKAAEAVWKFFDDEGRELGDLKANDLKRLQSLAGKLYSTVEGYRDTLSAAKSAG